MRMPSIVAPSFDFQLITSRVPTFQPRIWSLIAVTVFGAQFATSLTAISGSRARRTRGEGGLRGVAREREPAEHAAVGPRYASEAATGRVEPEEMRCRFLRAAEPDRASLPFEQAGVLVEGVGERARCATVRRHDGDARIRREVPVVPHGRGERDLRSVRRPHRVVVRPALVHDLANGVGRSAVRGKRDHIDVGRQTLDEIRIDGRAERDLPAVGRPVELLDGEVRPFVRRRPDCGSARAFATSNV